MPALRIASYPARNRSRAHRTRLPRNFAPPAEQGHGRNTTDIEALRKILRYFGVDLHQANRGFEHSGCSFEFRRHRPAGPAPRRPEVDHDRKVAVGDMPVEARFIQFDRMAVEQGLVAVAAAWPGCRARCGHAIGGIAMRADNMDGGAHDAFSGKLFLMAKYGFPGPKLKGMRGNLPRAATA